ncbi:MAG: thiolase family protein [Acidimicrobiales bacterium]
MNMPIERNAVISGIGQSRVGRRLNRSDVDLTVEAALAAIADAGLTRDDIDGLATYPGGGMGGAPFAGPTSPEVQDALRLKLNWHDGGGEGPGQVRAVFAASLAVAAGLARHVLVYRTVTESTAQGSGGRQGIGAALGGSSSRDGLPRFGGTFQWFLPYGAMSAANWLALVAQRRVHEYGLKREQLGQIALNNRRFAQLNPNAVYRDPMTLDDYLAARTITSPLCLYDCDAPCDGSTAVIVSHVDYAPDAPKPAAHVNAIGTALRGRPSWDQFDDMTTMAARDAAASMWTRTDLRPSDIDTAQLYDGFSIITMVWLEELGFCAKGESGPYVENGVPIPLNTSGGQLSGGRLHGFGLLHEAVVQLRGEGGDRQVGSPEVAVVANGGGPIAGSMLLTRGPS